MAGGFREGPVASRFKGGMCVTEDVAKGRPGMDRQALGNQSLGSIAPYRH